MGKRTNILIGILLIILITPIIGTMVPAGPIHFMKVKGTSMEPTITADDIVVVAPTKEELVVGDIIVYHIQFEGTEPLVAHRIVELTEGGYRTKGDAYDVPDTHTVSPEDVIGIVCFRIPYLGWLLRFASTNAGLLALVVAPALLIIKQELHKIFRN